MTWWFTDAAAAATADLLRARRQVIETVIGQVDAVLACGLPGEHGGQWTSPAQRAYVARLRELRERLAQLLTELEAARRATELALTSLVEHSGPGGV